MRIQYFLTLLCFALLGAATLQAQTQYIGPDGGDWFAEGNWNNGLPASGNDALIGGGVTVAVASPLSVDFTITNFGGIAATAAVSIQNGGSIANSGTLTGTSITNNGTFQNFGSATFAGPGNFINESGANFTNGGSFTLQTTLVNRGTILNNGTMNAADGTLQTEGAFNNNQTLTTESLTIAGGSLFTNNFGSNLNITGAAGELIVNGNFDNFGSINAEGTFTINGQLGNSSLVTVEGVLTVNAGATFNNTNGTLTNNGDVQNYGTFTNGFQFVNNGSANNFGQFNNNNLLDNRTGATFNNRPGATFGMGFGSQILNAGTFNNQSAINSFGTITNNGTFNNNGAILSFSGSTISNGADFTNSGEISTNDQVTNGGNFTNNGQINVNAGSLWSNNASFLNTTGGSINVVQDFRNNTSGTLTNNGRFSNRVRTRNEGNFINNAFLDNVGDFTNAADATLTNNELLLQSAGNILNEGTLANTDHLLSDECSSVNNKGTINNTGNFELHGILFQTGTLTGNAVNVQGGYVHTSASSNAPSVCQGGTFGANIDGDVKVYAGELVAFSNFDSCANIIYLANGIDRPVFTCSDIGSVLNLNVVVRTRLGDSLTCTAPVMPVDLLEPQFDSCPKDVVVFTPNATVAVDWTSPTAEDNCTATTLTASHEPGDSFPVGITGVTYTATDDYGNINNCQFRVDVRQTPAGSNCAGDTQAPTFAGCPGNISLITAGNGAIATWTPPTPNDNCYPLFLNSSHVPGQSFGVGTTTVTYTAEDGNGNEGTCEFTVTVTAENPCLTDNQPPSFNTCPANIYAPANPATGGAVAIWSVPGAFDLCGVSGVVTTHQPGSVFPTGATTVTYTATDNTGNSSTCNFVVTVGNDPCPDDTTPPAISGCPSNISILSNGNSGVASWTPPTATDACALVTVNSNYTPGSTFQLGTTTVRYQFSDGKGNTSFCTFSVTINNACSVDNVPPVISGCPSNLTVPAVNGFGVATWTPPTATDNCGLAVFSASFLPGASFPVGTTTVIYSALDLKGNGATCQFNVTVVNAPGCTTNAAPIEGTTNVDPASVTLSWNTANNAASYDVYLGTSNPPTTVVASNVSGTSIMVTGLNGGTTYFWYVVPKNNAGSATGCGSSATSFSTSGTPGGGCNTEVLFVVGSTNLNNSDATVKSKLEALGLNVTVMDDSASKTSDADGKALIVISSTTNSGNVNTKFRDVEVPVICYESFLYDDFKMTYSSSSYYGTSSNEYKMKIANSSHPIAAGLSGTIHIFDSKQTVPWGRPLSSATVIGLEDGSSVRSLVFAYETGANMVGMSAPARRIGFFLYDDSGDNMTADGLKIFNAAVSWATGIQQPGAACDDGNPNTENDVIQVDGCTCAGTPVCDGAVTGFVFDDVNGGPDVTLVNGGSYPVNALPASYNIEALVSGSSESALLELSGPVSVSKIENFVPYHVNGTGGTIVLTPGNYSLTVTLYSQDNAAGATCSQTSISFTILENDPCLGNSPVATVSSTNATCNQGNGSITFTFPDHPNRTNIEFSIDNGNTYPYNVPDNSGSTTISNLAAGTYQVWVRWGNNECPTSLGEVTIQNVNTPPNAVCKNITLQLASIGQSVQINGQQLDNGSTAGCGSILTYNASPTSFSQPGTYTATLTVTNSLGQSATCNSTVTVLAPGCDNVTNGGQISKSCQDGTVVLDNQSSPTGGSGNIEYMWIAGTLDCNPDNMSPVQNANGPTLSVNPPIVTTYYIRCSRRNGCTEWDGESNCISVAAGECGPASGDICPGTPGAGLTREVWYGISGTKVSNLTGNPSYPGNPGLSEVYANSVGPWHIADNYGTRVQGYINPSQSGNYKFVVTGDDQTELYLSSSENPAAKVKIAWIDGWTNNGQFDKYSSQTSASISLTAGQNYYVELLHKEGGGGDGWGIYWIKPGTSGPAAIPSQHLTPISKECGSCNSKVLFVVGSTNLNNGDAWVKNRLEQLGYIVEVKNDNYVSASDAGGKGLVVISSTVNSGNVGSTFTHVSVPVVTWEPYLYDDLKIANSFGNCSSQYKVYIENPGHPIAAGLSGTESVYTYYQSMNWGWVSNWGNDAIKIASVSGEYKYAILAYEKDGEMMDNFHAPERRVTFFIDDNSAVYLDNDGKALFDAAINWASGCKGVGERSEALSLNAWKEGFDTKLLWVTNTADLDQTYVIERSADGQVWDEILTMENQPGEDESGHFRNTDTDPLPGLNFYRLKTIRKDGAVRYSSVEEVQFAVIEDYAVFPNPAKDRIFVDLGKMEGHEVLLRLFDAKGVLVQEWEINASGEPVELQLRSHNAGQYLLWMYTEGKRPISTKVVLERF